VRSERRLERGPTVRIRQRKAGDGVALTRVDYDYVFQREAHNPSNLDGWTDTSWRGEIVISEKVKMRRTM
jgi:hypothetical protein